MKARYRKGLGLTMMIFVLCGLTITTLSDNVQAQGGTSRWETPVALSAGATEGGEQTAIAADKAGYVHVIWDSKANASDVQTGLIYYTQWDGSTWSLPVDIVASQGIGYPNIVADSSGYLHLTYYSGCYAYITAFYAEATSARGWSTPVCLDTTAVSQNLIIDQWDVLHVVYVGTDNTLRYRRSEDGGVSWSLPVVVGTGPDDAFLHMPAVAVDGEGGIHVIWSAARLPEGYPPTGIFYSRSLDDGISWTYPVTLQEGVAAEPAIVARGSTLYAVWGSALSWAKRFYCSSPDRGQSWGQIVELVNGGGGLLWQPSLAVDSTGMVHVVTNEEYPGALYLYGLDDRWSTPETIYAAPMAHARLALGLGNQLHLVFRDQRDASVQYMRLELPVPPETPQPFATPIPLPMLEPGVSQTITIASPTVTRLPLASDQSEMADPALLPVFWGGGLALILVAFVVLCRARH